MYQNYIKRFVDLLVSLLLSPFVLLVILTMAPFIYFTDKGPVFYNAIRSGKGYKPFKMFKLRSMFVNAPDLRNKDESTFNSDKDPRVTKIGRFLRKTSIDELPQILNVLIGNMSFVGPRPTIYYPERRIEEMPEVKQKRYSIRPGITGYSQAYFRNSISQDDKFKYDAYYADHISFLLDIKVIIKTFLSVLAHENIYIEKSQLSK